MCYKMNLYQRNRFETILYAILFSHIICFQPRHTLASVCLSNTSIPMNSIHLAHKNNSLGQIQVWDNTGEERLCGFYLFQSHSKRLNAWMVTQAFYPYSSIDMHMQKPYHTAHTGGAK